MEKKEVKPAGPQVARIANVLLGCDPELFLATKSGSIIGAERVIPENGLFGRPYGTADVVLDGVQVELNPSPSFCRQTLAGNISASMRALRTALQSKGDIHATFRQVVEVDPKELDTLSDKAKILGCQPSLNIYDTHATIGVDPATYTKRSAGGHIHLGLTSQIPGIGNKMMKERERLVPLLDIFVGNTCVLMDRDPGNVERRQVYGRAGEHRLPKHGLEYRTLSNFWLKSYALMSGVMALSRFSVDVLANTLLNGKGRPSQRGFPEAEATILKMVDLEQVQEAINTNNVELAKKNWKVVSKFIAAHHTSAAAGITGANLKDFNFFIEKIDEKGLEYWFKRDPMLAWTTINPNPLATGWESFLSKTVRNRRLPKVKVNA